MPSKSQKLVEKFRIVQIKDGAVYKTQSMGEEWVPIHTEMYKMLPFTVGSTFYAPLSTYRQEALNYKTTRIVEIG